MHPLIFNTLFISIFTAVALSVNIPVREIGLSSFEHLFHDGTNLNQIYAIFLIYKFIIKKEYKLKAF